MQRMVWLFCFLPFFSFGVSAAPKLANPVFQSLSTKNGLPQDVVNHIQIDDEGFVWIATEGGVVRWDGTKTQLIRGPDDLFINLSIDRLSIEQGKALWISTFSGGVYRLDFKTNQTEQVVALPYAHQSDWIQNAEDFFWHNEHTLYLALPEQVVRYNTVTSQLDTVFYLEQSLVAEEHGVRAVHVLDDVLIIATSAGVFYKRLQDPASSVQTLDYLNGIEPDIDNQNAKLLFRDDNEGFWIGTVSGVYRTTLSDLRSQLEGSSSSRFTAHMPMRNVWTMETAGDSSFWLGTNKGLYSLTYDGDGWQSEHVLEPHNGRSELSNKRIRTLATDKTGNLWLGSIYGGALYFGVKSAEIETIQNTRFGDNKLLSDGVIWSLAQTDEDSLWIGTENGLNRYYFETKSTEQYLFSDSELFEPGSAAIQRIIPQSNGQLFLQSYYGIRIFDPETGEITRPQLSEGDNHVFDAWNSGMNIDSVDRLYFIGSEFYRYSPQTQTVEVLPLDEEIFDVSFSVGFLGESSYHDGKMFLSMMSGLWLFDPETFESELVYLFSEEQRSNLQSVSSWVIDDNRVLWLAFTGYGLFGLDADTFEPLYHLSEDNLLLSNIVYGLKKDDRGNIWFSSHNGLHQYSPVSGQVYNFIYGRELPVSEFNEGAVAQLAGGELAYGSTSGVVVFSPETLRAMDRSGSLLSFQSAITGVTSGDQELGLPFTNLHDMEITLSHRENSFTVDYSAMTMSSAGNVKYHFRFQKGNQVISEGVTRDSQLTITNVEPGEYTFTVTPTPGSLEFSVLPAEIRIVMPHAPWRSPLAYGIYGAVLLALLVAILLSRKKQLFRLQNARQEAALFSEAFKQTRDWVVIFNEQREPVAANPAFEMVFGIDSKQSLPAQMEQIYRRSVHLSRQLVGKLEDMKPGEFWREEAIIESPEGRRYDTLIAVTAMGQESVSSHFLLVISDISEQKSAERKLLKMANYDNLTGLVNRSLLLDRLEHAIANSRHHQSRVAVMFIDLDRFKGINDSLGHDYGDKLLRVVANRMRNLVADKGTVARLGGDEFVIVIEEVSHENDLSSFVSQIIDAVETPIALASEMLRVSCSVGVAFYPDDAVEPAELIKRADVAMYSAKKDALNGFAYFTSDMNEKARQRLLVENLVKRGYLESCFFNHYQPIVDAITGKVVGVELLLRCKIDDDPLYPDVFIPVLEQLRYIVDVTRLAMQDAAADLAKWYESGFNGFVAINLSALHFKSEFDIDFVAELLASYGLPKQAFRFEITEGVLMDDSDMSRQQIQRLVDAGFILALDDFGTGYSSLSYLKRYPLSVLKIDKSFIFDMTKKSADNALVDTTIALAANLGMRCVAEGVETAEQAESLLEKNCRYHQGYFYAKPAAADDLSTYLLNHL